MNHRIEITIVDEGRDTETSDRLVDAIHDLLPAADPVIEQDLEGGSLTAAFAVDARAATEAATTGLDAFRVAVGRAGIGAPRTIELRACPARAGATQL